MSKTICLGITGGIAAYKCPDLARKLIKAGFNVVTVMTQNATNIVTKLAMETVTNNPVCISMFDQNRPYEIEHIALAKKSDALLIVPATANIIAKLAHGVADDLLSTTAMAMSCPVVVAPAMNTNMYMNPAFQENLKIIKNNGLHIIDPADGLLACGDSGIGKLADLDIIVEYMKILLYENKDFLGKNILVTAGPTRQMIDPIRFVSNRSSGKMGYALATAAKLRGANVTLVAGPNSLPEIYGINTMNVITTKDMYDVCMDQFDLNDIIIKAAAPGDFYVENTSTEKIKKNQTDGGLQLVLKQDTDILLNLGQNKTHQKLIGFAAETNNVKDYALKKLKNKNLDMIVANDVSKSNSGFNIDTNKVTIFTKDGEVDYEGSKLNVAHKILDLIKTL